MRRKLKLAYIDNDIARKASFKKRRSGLIKKVRELTILCDVSACVVIYGPGEFDPVAVWPNEDEARRLIRRFRMVPEMDRCKKMVTQESYLRERAGKMSHQIRKLVQRNKETVLEHVMRKIGAWKPLDDLGIGELKGIMSMLEDKTKELNKRMMYLQKPKPVQIFRPRKREEKPAGISLPPPTPEEMAGRRDFPLDWTSTDLRIQSKPPGQNTYRDFLGGFREVRYQQEIGNQVMNVTSPFGNGVGLGYGFGSGGLGMADEMDIAGSYNQEMKATNNDTNLNVSLGLFQPGSGINFGVNNNGADLANMLSYLNAGYNAGNQGLAPSEAHNTGGNNVNAGVQIEEIDLGYETGKSAESDDNAEASNNFGKHWPYFFSPAP